MFSRSSSLLLQPTRQEKAVGLLAASLLLLSVLTLVMLIAWISQVPGHQMLVTRLCLPPNHEQAAGSTGAADTAKALEDQGTDEELPELTQAAEQLHAVSSLVNSELALLEGNGLPARGRSGINGDDDDGRRIGPNGPDGPVIPAWQRWQIHYSAADIQEYAAILDAFRVELGVMGGGEPAISYARNLAQTQPQIRRGAGKDERRLRFVFTRGDLKEADRALALQAGLSVDGRIVAQFYPDDVKQQLELLEKGAIGARPLASVRRTVFGIRKAAGRWEFFVERVEPAQPSGGLAPL
jgi:hypothetical protein